MMSYGGSTTIVMMSTLGIVYNIIRALYKQEMGENLSKVRQHFPDFYEAHHSDDWHRLIGLRNAISHGYGEIDMHIVWRIVSTELQRVVDALARLNHSEHA